MLERLNQEIKRRTHVVRIFPDAASCLRLVRALAVETHENWLESDPLPEHGSSEGAQEAGAAACGMTPRTRPVQASRRARCRQSG